MHCSGVALRRARCLVTFSQLFCFPSAALCAQEGCPGCALPQESHGVSIDHILKGTSAAIPASRKGSTELGCVFCGAASLNFPPV